MVHFALIDENNKVTRVMGVSNEHEHRAVDFLSIDCGMPGRWIQTSQNTYRGKHFADKEPLRKNYAGIGFYYDESIDAFIPPKPFPSWTFNDFACNWDPPVPFPSTDQREFYRWNEEQFTWIKINPVQNQ